MTIRCFGVSLGRGSSLNCPITIGSGTAIGYRFSAKGFGVAYVGKYCAIGDDVKIITSNHDFLLPSINLLFQHSVLGDKTPQPYRESVEIGNDVWIGDNVTILAGVEIGNGAVIGAGAVVTRSVGAYEVWAGIPARHIKWRIDKSMVESMEQLSWWNWDAERIALNKEFFGQPVSISSIASIK